MANKITIAYYGEQKAWVRYKRVDGHVITKGGQNLLRLVRAPISAGMVPINELSRRYNHTVESNITISCDGQQWVHIRCTCMNEDEEAVSRGQNLPKLDIELISEGMVPFNVLLFRYNPTVEYVNHKQHYNKVFDGQQ